MAEPKDMNVPKMAQRSYEANKKYTDQMAQGGWVAEALNSAFSGGGTQLVEDDRAIQIERERELLRKKLEREKRERSEVVTFLGEQTKAKPEPLVLGKSTKGATSVLGGEVIEERKKKKPKKKATIETVVVEAKEEKQEEKKNKEHDNKAGSLSMLLGAYK
jgi:hypothetical protein